MTTGILLGTSGYFGYSYQVHQEAISDAQAEAAEETRLARIGEDKEKAFSDNYSSITYNAADTGSKAEKIGNELLKVWHAVIWDDSVTIDGQKYTDISKAVNAQHKLYISNGTIDKLDSSLAGVEATYKRLKKNVTSKNTDKLEEMEKTIKSVRNLVKIVRNPSGNYTTFSDKFSDADSEVSTNLEQIM